MSHHREGDCREASADLQTNPDGVFQLSRNQGGRAQTMGHGAKPQIRFEGNSRMILANILPLAVAYCTGLAAGLFALEATVRRKYRLRLRRQRVRFLQQRRS